MRGGGVGGGGPALCHQRRQVSHQDEGGVHRDCWEPGVARRLPLN